jgi:hypothetical protein
MKALQAALQDVFGVSGSFEGIEFAGRTDPWIIRQIFLRFGIENTKENVASYVDRYVAALPGILGPERHADPAGRVRDPRQGGRASHGRPGAPHGKPAPRRRGQARLPRALGVLPHRGLRGRQRGSQRARAPTPFSGPRATGASISRRTARGSSGTRPTTSPARAPSGPVPWPSQRAARRSPSSRRSTRTPCSRAWATPARSGARSGPEGAEGICLPSARPRGVFPSQYTPPHATHLHDRDRIGPRRIQVQGADQGHAPGRRAQRAGHGHGLGGALRFPGLHPAGGRGGGAGRIRARDRARRLGQRRGDRGQPRPGHPLRRVLERAGGHLEPLPQRRQLPLDRPAHDHRGGGPEDRPHLAFDRVRGRPPHRAHPEDRRG